VTTILIHGVETTPEEFVSSLPYEARCALAQALGANLLGDGDKCTECNAKAFWGSLRDPVAIALVKLAPRVADPWRQTNTGAWVRGYDDVNDMPYDNAAVICPALPGQWHWYSQTGKLTFGSPEAAKAAADAHLRANGWLLESEAAE
jgi:hypothetical protein